MLLQDWGRWVQQHDNVRLLIASPHGAATPSLHILTIVHALGRVNPDDCACGALPAEAASNQMGQAVGFNSLLSTRGTHPIGT